MRCGMLPSPVALGQSCIVEPSKGSFCLWVLIDSGITTCPSQGAERGSSDSETGNFSWVIKRLSRSLPQLYRWPSKK